MRYPALDRLLVVQANILKVGLWVDGGARIVLKEPKHQNFVAKNVYLSPQSRKPNEGI